jgi:hypothetical protein
MELRNAMLAVSLAVVSGRVYAADEVWSGQDYWGAAEYVRFGDFNGDGTTDIGSRLSGHGFAIKFSNGVDTFTGLSGTSCLSYMPYGNYDWVRVGDFDGNGVDDYVSPFFGTAYLYRFPAAPYHNGCPNQMHPVPINSTWGNAGYTWAGDFNGDGYDDIASASGSNVYMKFGGAVLNSGVGFGSATWTVTNQWGQGAYSKAGDFNGDGYADIASFAGGNAYMKLSTGSGFTSTTWSVDSQWNQGAYTFTGDYNGDGYDDVASCGGSVCYMKQSTGSGFTNPGNEYVDPTWNNAWYVGAGDFEADGNDDIAVAYYNLVYMKLVSQ